MADTVETTPIINWQEQLLDSEKGKDGNTEFVYLRGLRRLAKLKGISSEKYPFINTNVLRRHDTNVEYPFVQVCYEVTFKDGSTFSDVADAHTYNVEGVFSLYPTAIAATRAEARALRKGLDISLVAKEELGADEEVAAEIKGRQTSAQLRVIKSLIKTRGVNNQSELISSITTRENVLTIEDLSFDEAKKAIKWLNERKVAK